jgi:hypothetical protein
VTAARELDGGARRQQPRIGFGDDVEPLHVLG